ncbi:MAG: hypothetical protein EA417_09015 [Gammaproteobacteria bacterium]|nr:MAG: hypothetical protein EA417_09015 [Gammaproteobacteria bacterium]
MGPFELAALAVIAGCLLSAFKAYKKSHRGPDPAVVTALEAEICDLKERVGTLESIVTDRSYHLNEEISRL